MKIVRLPVPVQKGATILDTPFVEEAIATWDGEPMGVDCAGPDKYKRYASPVSVGYTMSLPDRDQQRRRRLPRPEIRLGVSARYAGSSAGRAFHQPRRSYVALHGQL